MSTGLLVQLFRHQPVVSEGFDQWMADERVGVLFVSGGRLWAAGATPDGTVDLVERSFDGSVSAVAATGDGMLLANWQVWRYANGLAPGALTADGHDRLLLPQAGVTVGDVGICDVEAAPGGAVFASTRLGCLAALDRRWSFRIWWMPPWQTALADQDRCHIGGFTVDDTGRTWVACAAQSDTADGWRSNRLGGGCLVGTDGRVLTEGLTLPRTPRAVGDQLLVANAGTGELLAVDLASGTTDVVAAWPEPCVALAVHKRWALVGLSAASGVDYEDLPVADRGAGPHASGAGADGLALVDLDSGRVVGTLHLDGRSLGVSSITVLEGCRRPAVVVPRSAPARDMVVVGPPERLPVASGPSSEMPV